MRAAAAIALAVAATVSVHGAEAKDRPPLPDERPKDKDEQAEAASRFWGRTLRPTADAYQANVARARELLRTNGSEQELKQAQALLEAAVAAEPETPDAYWWLGYVQHRRLHWADCARSLATLFDLAPDFESPETRDGESALDLRLANCAAYAGDFEKAIAHYKRILADNRRRDPTVRWRLGNTFMALGQLGDAITAYESAIAEQRSPFPYFAAAVAYDRDEQEARSRERLEIALRRDPTLSSLNREDLRFVPDNDEYYFKGLAYAARGRTAHALVYFRRYIAVGEPAWHHRTKKHLEALEARSFEDDDLLISGSAHLDRDRAGAAIMRRARALHRCLDESPELLVEIRITSVASGDHKEQKRAKKDERTKRKPSKPVTVIARFRSVHPSIRAPEGGVRVESIEQFDAPASAVSAAIQCVRQQAETIKLPRPTGRANSYATVTLFVTRRQ